MKFTSYLALSAGLLIGPLFAEGQVEKKSLAQQLQEQANKKNPMITPEISKAFADGIAAVDDADVVAKAKQVGGAAPDFTLSNAAGKKVRLSDELKKGPVVLTWYRGGW